MIDSAGFADLRNYIKRRVAYAKYRVGNTYIKTDLSDVAVLPNGTVRAQLTISAESTPLTVTRVELYNSDNALWAHQDCSITVNTGADGHLVLVRLYRDRASGKNAACERCQAYAELCRDRAGGEMKCIILPRGKTM